MVKPQRCISDCDWNNEGPYATECFILPVNGMEEKGVHGNIVFFLTFGANVFVSLFIAQAGSFPAMKTHPSLVSWSSKNRWMYSEGEADLSLNKTSVNVCKLSPPNTSTPPLWRHPTTSQTLMVRPNFLFSDQLQLSVECLSLLKVWTPQTVLATKQRITFWITLSYVDDLTTRFVHIALAVGRHDPVASEIRNTPHKTFLDR